MNVAGFYDESISNGAGGHRAVLFVSGCPHHCPGCHNKDAQDFSYGKQFNEQEYLDRIKDNSIIKGITISGGEPLCKENVSSVLNFIKDVKKVRPEFNVWCYTGYTLEQLKQRQDEETKNVLKEIDVLVDGPFIEEKKDKTLAFKGSSNQRIIDLKKSMNSEEIIKIG